MERQGYIEIEHRGRKSNLYKIIDLPKKFLEAPTGAEVGFEDAYEKIRMVGLKQYGYGKIPKSIFENKKISFVAKTIYAVHCVFGGYAQGDRATHPSRRLIMNILGICERTYSKHQRILAENGYISAVQRYDGNQFSINNYTLAANPTQSPFPERALAVGKTDDNGKFVISYIKKFGAAVRSVVESVANVAEVITEKVAEAVRPADKTTRKEPVVDLSYLIRYGGDREQVEQVIHRLTNWDINNEWAMKNGTFDDFQHRTYRIANEALVAMCNDDYRLSNGVVIASEKILAKIFEYRENFYTEAIETALYNYQTAIDNGTEIKIPLRYMQSCLWTALQTGDMHTANAIQRDFGGRTGGFQNRKSRRGRL
ncbi:hypothetical protein FACS1894188_10830 [Clostridia bacterium]|nr:hypothetical protein FACS1894188_10830 [Clostridia bacterium]